MEFTPGQFYSLKRKIKGKHKGRYDQGQYRKVMGKKGERPPGKNGALQARRKVSYAIKTGRLQKLPCSVCGDPKSQGHHHKGYDHPLDVEWLCQSCHKRKEYGNENALNILKGDKNGKTKIDDSSLPLVEAGIRDVSNNLSRQGE